MARVNPDNPARKLTFPGGRAAASVTGQSQPAHPQRRLDLDYLYSLYDALVSIHVPNDKARAVVDAMERDMSTTIATKSDLLLLRSDLHVVRQELKSDLNLLKADLNLLRQELTSQISGLATREEMLGIRAEMRENNALIRKDLEFLSTTMTVRLGSMLMFGLGLLFAALKLT